MASALTLVLAAVVAQTPLPAQPQQPGATVTARAKVEILRGEVNSESGGAESLRRHVSHPEPGRVTIAFE